MHACIPQGVKSVREYDFGRGMKIFNFENILAKTSLIFFPLASLLS